MIALDISIRIQNELEILIIFHSALAVIFTLLLPAASVIHLHSIQGIKTAKKSLRPQDLLSADYTSKNMETKMDGTILYLMRISLIKKIKS